MSGVHRAKGAAVLLGVLAVAACTPGAPERTPPPTPPPSVSQSPSETPQERQERLDYAAAEKAYRTFRAEYNRVLRAGGAKEPTKVMKATAGGAYLSELMEVVRAAEGLGDRQEGREKIVYVRPNGYSATEIDFKVCEDARRMTIVGQDGRSLGNGDLRIASLRLKKVGMVWKLWSGQGQKVKSCD